MQDFFGGKLLILSQRFLCSSLIPQPYSDFYNNELPHMRLDWKTPAEAALCSGELKKKWVSHKENFLKKEIV